MISPELFVQIVQDVIHREGDDERPWALGTIPASYTSGRPTVQFDGETAPSTKAYPYLNTYSPTANARVLLLHVGHTWVVLGRLI